LTDLAGLLAWLAAEYLPVDRAFTTLNSGMIIQQVNGLGQWSMVNGE